MENKIPNVKKGESEQDYVSRCIPIVMKEGNVTRQQAAGKCFGMYREYKNNQNMVTIHRHSKQNVFKYNDKRPPKEWFDKTVEELKKHGSIDDPEALASWIWYHQKENAKIVEGFKSPEPGSLSEKGANMLAKVYASCRLNGGDKEKCAKESWSAVEKVGLK